MENKKFYLSNNKKIAGVCAGISEYFNIDVVFVRVLFIAGVVSGVLSSLFILTYIAFWIVAPRKENV
ncbi:MAG: PspC domain-containing protein [Elusimicrobiales bacterium]|jgi:phage shock protein PspC (stress-responsive transcriptional regulator)|nr:PspC domain-containing protein [Elusimicrobiales bacterium]NLH38705.1 PspC domain-containing protein [Elusimicrobiota bacterium]